MSLTKVIFYIIHSCCFGYFLIGYTHYKDTGEDIHMTAGAIAVVVVWLILRFL